MAKLNRIYRCRHCGNIVTVLHEGDGTLVCCGEDMKLLEEKTKDQGKEKHVPVIEKTKDSVKVKVGSVEHPMTEEHFIEFIPIIADGKTYTQHLKPGQKPEATFQISAKSIKARSYCNLHGLWKS